MKESKEKVYCSTCMWMMDLEKRGIRCEPPTGETFSDYLSPKSMVFAKPMYCSKRNKNNNCPYYTKKAK